MKKENNGISTLINTSFDNPLSETVNINYLVQNNNFCIEGLELKVDDFDDFIQDIKDLKDLKETNSIEVQSIDLSVKSEAVYIYNGTYETSDFAIAGNMYKETFNFDIFAKDVHLANTLFNTAKKYETENDRVLLDITNINYNGKFTFKTNTKYLKDFKDISVSYYPYLDTDELFKQFLKSSSNILILTGEMGIGKSKFVSLFLKYVMENAEEYYQDFGIDTGEQFYFNTSLVKNSSALSEDEFWGDAIADKQLAVVFDDMDALLHRRDAIDSELDIQQNKFMSHLLSYSDGIIKGNNKTKIIITTNEKIDKIDPALLRSGRMFDILKFRDLTLKEARMIWDEEKLDLNKFNTYVKHTDDKVKSSDLGTAIEKLKNEISLGQNFKTYCKEEGISVLQDETKNKKKIGVI